MLELEASKYLENITKAVALVTALSYGTGFVVVNAYLSQYGLSDYSIISARFIFAGILCGIFLFIWWMFVGSYFNIAENTISAIDTIDNKSRFRKITVFIQLFLTEILHRVIMAASLFAIIVFKNFDIYDLPIGLVILSYVAFMQFDEYFVPKIGIFYLIIKILIQLIVFVFFLVFAERSVLLVALNYISLLVLFALSYKFVKHDGFSLKNMEQKIYFFYHATWYDNHI